MGSLMAGWDSPTLGHKSAILRRNRSLTKEEIDAYWKTKKEIEEEHLRSAISNISEDTIQANRSEDSDSTKSRESSSMVLARVKESLMADEEGDDTSLEKLTKKNGWWTRSNWAFLNEPPVDEETSNTYAAQFHVANMASSRFNAGAGISAN